MTDAPNPNGWPGAPGVPLNPERDGWHWIEPKFGPAAAWPALWVASRASGSGGYWEWKTGDESDHADYAEHMRNGSWKYRGPCLTPAEVAARVAAASAGWQDAAAQHLRNEEWMRGLLERIGNLFGDAARTADDGSVQDSVLLLRVPELVERLHAEVAARVAEARADGMREAAGIAADADLGGHFFEGEWVGESREDIAAAILAAIEKEPHHDR